MTEPNVKSAGITPRRALLEEVLEERSKAVATLPVIEEDPPWSSLAWPMGIMRLATASRKDPAFLREHVRNVAVVALAWLEAIDRELPADRGAGRQQDPVG